MDTTLIVAIEVSSSQIKGAVASIDRSHEGAPVSTIEALSLVDDTSSVLLGRIQNIADAAKQVMNIRQNLQEKPILQNKPITGVYVGLGGRSLISEHVTATLEFPTEMEITTDYLKRLYSEAAKAVSPTKKTLHILPRRYMVDNQPMNNPVGAPAHRLRGDFTVVTCNPVNERYLDMVFKQRLEFPNVRYVVTPLAIADMVLAEEEKQLGCVLVDFGYQTTTISIYKDRALQYLATLPLGSHNITLDIASVLNCTIAKAEAIKISRGDARAADKGDAETQRINSYIQARANEIIANIKAQIEYAGYKVSDLSAGFIISGRGAKLRNLESLLENNTKLRVRTAEIAPNINFKLSDPTLDPKDYLSLLAIVDKVAHGKEIMECIEDGHKPPVQAEPAAAPASSTQETRQTAQSHKPRMVEDDENLLKDDPVPGKNKTPETAGLRTTEPEQPPRSTDNKRKSLLARIKSTLTDVLSDDKDENI